MDLFVPDISCEHCKMRVENSLKEITGIDTVIVNIDEKTVSITGNPDKGKVITALEEAGYKAEEKE